MLKRLSLLMASVMLLSSCFVNTNTIALESGIYKSDIINEHLDGVGMVNEFEVALVEIDHTTYKKQTNNIIIDRMNKTYYQVTFKLMAINQEHRLDLKYLGMKFERYRYSGTYSYFDIIVTLDMWAQEEDKQKLDYIELRFHIYEAGDKYRFTTNLFKQ